MSWFKKDKKEKLPELCKDAELYCTGLYKCTTERPCEYKQSYGWLKICRVELRREELSK